MKNNFEDMMKQLEEITDKLESGELPLDESVELFGKGVALTKSCNELLESAKQKIVKITEQSDGSGKEEPFGIEE